MLTKNLALYCRTLGFTGAIKSPPMLRVYLVRMTTLLKVMNIGWNQMVSCILFVMPFPANGI